MTATISRMIACLTAAAVMVLNGRRFSRGAVTALVGGVIACLTATAVMVLIRITLQIRTVPERVMEAMLLVIPLDMFGMALQRFGFDAKRYALILTVVAMAVIMAVIGIRAITQRWSLRTIVLLGFGLWLAVMVLLMPVTGAGPFAIDLIDRAAATALGHAAIALAYVTVLAAVAACAARTDRPVGGVTAMPLVSRGPRPTGTLATRRSILALGVGAASTLLGTFMVERWKPRTVTRVVVVSEDAPAGAKPSGPVALTAPTAPVLTPTVAQSAAGAVERPAEQAPTPTPAPRAHATATPRPSLDDQFQPPQLRGLPRDRDGVVLASGRRPGQLADLITAADDFYVVSKNAAQDPVLGLDRWRLRVDGEVQRPVEIDYRSLRNLPSVETVKTLECISNFVTKCELVPFGCDLISTARWRGAHLKDILALAGGLKPGVRSLSVIAADDFTTTLPIEAVMDPDTLLVYEMDGQPLAREHGYPARVLIPGRYGMKNAKWVVALRPLESERDDWYGQRNWSRDGLVKTMTRIDSPARNAALAPGAHRMAGIAYAGDRGIEKVEVSSDGGESWRLAQIIDRPAGRDVWVRWESSFTLAASETITLMARATDGTGELQVEAFSLPQPDGSTGWHALDVHAQDAN